MDMSCPHCGAQLRVDSEQQHVQCEYCDSILLIDNEQRHTQFDNSEEAGYRFEMGRQRAQAEMSRQSHNDLVRSDELTVPAAPVMQAPPAKRRTWLWVLGWIFIPPLPLTILLIRKEDMKPIVKYAIIAAAWILYFAIARSNR